MAHVNVLLINDDPAETANVYDSLQKANDTHFLIHQYDKVPQAVDFLIKERAGIDIILLNFLFFEKNDKESFFRKIKGLVDEIPIIIFTGENDHDLALLIVKQGAADNVTPEVFTARPETLKSSIEFSIARNDILIKSRKDNSEILEKVQKQAAENLLLTEKRAAAQLKKVEKLSATALKESELKSAAELEESKKSALAKLKKMNAKRLLDIEYHKEIIYWMGGGYSIEPNVFVDNTEGIEKLQQEEAATLKKAQKESATGLEKNQKIIAVKLKETQADSAAELKNIQKNECPAPL